MTLYAIAYSLLFDSQTADAAVAAAFRELWRSAAALDATPEAWQGGLPTSRVARRLITGETR